MGVLVVAIGQPHMLSSVQFILLSLWSMTRKKNILHDIIKHKIYNTVTILLGEKDKMLLFKIIVH